MLAAMSRKNTRHLQQTGAAAAVVVCTRRRCHGSTPCVDRVKMSRDKYNVTCASSIAPLVGYDVLAGAAVDGDVLQPGGILQRFQAVARPARRIGIVDIS